MKDVVFFDDENKLVPDHVAKQLPMLNEGHYVIVIMDDGTHWHGHVSKSDDGSLWFVGGRRLMQVAYAPFKVWFFPWNILAIVNLADYTRYIQEDVLNEYKRAEEVREYEERMGQDL